MTTSGYTKDQLLTQFKTDTLSKLDEGFKYVLSLQQKEIQKILKQVSTDLGSKADITLGDLIALTDNPLVDHDKIWQDVITESVSALPQLVLLPQDELHFTFRENDTAFISFGKLIKRANRGLYRSGISIQNGLSRMLKKPEKTPVQAQREVPFKQIVASKIYENKSTISKWNIEYQRLVADILKDAQLLILNLHKQPTEGSKTASEFTEVCISRLEELFKTQKEELETVLQSLEAKISSVLEIVGTLELSEKKFTDELNEKSKVGFETELTAIHSNWNPLKQSFANRLTLAVELIKLRGTLTDRSELLFKKTNEFFKGNLEQPFEEVFNELERCMALLLEAKEPSTKELASICDSIQASIRERVSKTAINPLETAIENPVLSQYLESFISDVPGLSGNQLEKIEFIKDVDTTGLTPKFSIKEVDWQRFLKRMLGDNLVTEFVPDKLRPEEFLASIYDSYNEVIQIVDTNLEVVDEITRSEQEEPISIAKQGLERTKLKLQEIEGLISAKRDELGSLLDSKGEELFTTLADFLIKQDLSEMKWMEAQLMVKESAGDWNTKITVYWAKFLNRFDLARRFLTLKFNAYSIIVRKFFGISSTVLEKGEKTTLATFLHDTNQKFAQLPFIYRRLFDFHRDVEASFFVKNTSNFETCKKALDLWKGGFPASISILGEKGSGKSTFIRFLKEETFKDEKNYVLPFNSTVSTEKELVKEVSKILFQSESESVEELIKKIKKNRKGSIIFAENIQNCFLRNMNGYESVQALLYIISETKHEVLWVVTSSRYSWNFLSVVFNVGEYFTHSIQTDVLSDNEVESVIMRRQRASGYQLRFEADQAVVKSRAYKKYLDDDAAAQQYLQELFFEKITKLAEGNATVAMIFWIRSIKEFTESHFTIEAFKATDIERLDSLDSTALFALNAFILHDTLNADELALVLNSNKRECEMIISRLTSRGILVPNKKGEFTLNDLVYRQIVRLLKLRNILH